MGCQDTGRLPTFEFSTSDEKTKRRRQTQTQEETPSLVINESHAPLQIGMSIGTAFRSRGFVLTEQCAEPESARIHTLSSA